MIAVSEDEREIFDANKKRELKFCVFFSFQILKNFFYYHYLYYRAGLILTKNPVARKDSNYISVVPIVLLSSLRFFCTC